MLTAQEENVYESVINIINASYKIPCTGCNYCMPCPQNINIPACFAAYNISYTVGFLSGFQHYITSIGATDPRKNYAPSNCKECGKCEKKCPQRIPIIKSLKNVTGRLEPFWYKTVLNIFMKLRG
jgi:predicted aldo/keto reductase-like oxidoreductase